jgi:integrase
LGNLGCDYRPIRHRTYGQRAEDRDVSVGEADLERVYTRASERDQRLADVMLVDAWTGLRWSELRAIRVRDFIQVPMPILVIQRAEPEGVPVKSTKSNRTRQVPVADRVLLIVRALAEGREADAPLFVTASGHRLHASAFKRTLDWPNVAEGRRIHDLGTQRPASGSPSALMR